MGKIRDWINARRMEIQRGKEVTAQMKAERLRKKMSKRTMYEPGTIRYGMVHRQGPLELMEDVKRRRKQKREEKEGKH